MSALDPNVICVWPGCSFVSGSPTPNGGGNAWTGTPDISQRCNVIGDPYANLPKSGNGEVYLRSRAQACNVFNHT